MIEIELIRYLIGFASLVFVAEDLALRPQLAADGSRAWAVQRGDYISRGFRRGLDVPYSGRGLTLTLAARFAASLSLLIAPHAIDAAVLIIGTWAWSVRWRGTFNGGSDSMTLIVLIGVFAHLINPGWDRLALTYIAVHLILSFVVAGAAKMRNPAWRDGTALRVFGHDAGIRVSTAAGRAMSWALMIFELSFPVALTHPTAAWIYTGIGVTFHVVNTYVFGLNRFLWAWLPAYAAVHAIARGI